MMLDFDTALDLLNKYGYTSIQVHPFVYQDGDTIGICYTYVDEEFGVLERIKIFNNAEEFEEFLQMYNWVQVNGKLHHVRMILDNYESINPKVMFLRNEKIMVEGEMFDIESYDNREAMRVNMDPVSKVIYECGDLLLVYNEIKNRQLQYLKNIIKLKNTLRHKYYDLQVEVDKYNKVKVERNLTLLPEITDSGINEMLEVSIKDRYNLYISQRPEYNEALDFLKEVWELCLGLELNSKYYEAQKEENDIRNEMKVVDQKLTLMRSLNDELKPLFGIDLISRFRKINRVCKAESTTISNEFISQQIDAVNRKYSYFGQIDSLYTSDYLREAIQNSNYADLAIKYATGTNFDVVSKYKTPLNEVASSLSVQYRDKLSSTEQSILVLYNNPKYRMLCEKILSLDNFDKLPIKTILKSLNGIKGFSKIKSECYESVKKRIDDPVNQKIKTSLFVNFDFTTFESFIGSLVNQLAILRNVNEKMVLNGDINMYVTVDKEENLGKNKFVLTTNDLQGLIAEVKDSKNMVGITLLKEGTPVLYSPYYFDVGDIYSKGASPEMFIKEMVNFELLIDISDIVINIDPNKTVVAKYYSVPNIVENLSVVDDIKMSYKTTFCKFAFTSKLSTVVSMNQSQAVASNVSPVVNSVFDAGALAAMSTVPKAEPEANVAKEVAVDKPVTTEVKVGINDNVKTTQLPQKNSESVVAKPVVSTDGENGKTQEGIKVEVKQAVASVKNVESKPATQDAKAVPAVAKPAASVTTKPVVNQDVKKTEVTDVKKVPAAPVAVIVKPTTTVSTDKTNAVAQSVAKPAVTATSVQKPSVSTQTIVKPAVTQQPVAKSGTGQSTVSQPTTAKTVVSQNQVAKPVVQTKPATTNSAVTKPVAPVKPVNPAPVTQAKPTVSPASGQPAAKPQAGTVKSEVKTTTGSVVVNKENK